MNIFYNPKLPPERHPNSEVIWWNNNNNNTSSNDNINNNVIKQAEAIQYDDPDNDFIEDNLDKPGNINKARIHGSAKRILNVPKEFNNDQKVIFCNDCFLPQETKGIVDKFPYEVDPKKLAVCGYGIYLFFFFMKFLIINLIGVFIICSVPYIYITNILSNELFSYCTEFYTNTTAEVTVPLETKSNYCLKFVKTTEFDYTSFDWINQWNGETMLVYVGLLKEIQGIDKADQVVENYSFMTFVLLIILLVNNILFILWSTANVNEIDFHEQSPSDYTLMISDIPTTKNNAIEWKNNFLFDNSASIHEINLTYLNTKCFEIKEEIRNLKKTKRINKGKDSYTTGYLCWKKENSMSEWNTKIRKWSEQNYKLEIETSSCFSGVAFVTFSTETEADNYYDQFPHSFMGKAWTNWFSIIQLTVCKCCISDDKKAKLRRMQTIAVSRAPEPEDVWWNNLEFHFLTRWWRSCLGYLISWLCISVSFGIVLGWNYVQSGFDNVNFILKYGISLCITGVITFINTVMSTLFTIFARYEKPWSYTELYWSLSIKLTIFTFFNSAIVPFASNLIRYGAGNYENLVNNMLMMFLCGSLLNPLISISCYEYFYKKFLIYWFEKSHKDGKEAIKDMSQRELNSLYENPDMAISVQYSILFKQMLMVFFYMPIFPLGALITFIGIILKFIVEKFKCVRIYKRPEMLNQDLCFFYWNYFPLGLWTYGIGNYIFFAGTHKNNFYDWFNIFFYSIWSILPFNSFIRHIDWSGVSSNENVNRISYEDAYFSFPFDYERLNPKTQKQGVVHYLEKLEKNGIITHDVFERVIQKINKINIMELFHFQKAPTIRVKKRKHKQPNEHQPLNINDDEEAEEEEEEIPMGKAGYYNDKGDYFNRNQVKRITNFFIGLDEIKEVTAEVFGGGSVQKWEEEQEQEQDKDKDRYNLDLFKNNVADVFGGNRNNEQNGTLKLNNINWGERNQRDKGKDVKNEDVNSNTSD